MEISEKNFTYTKKNLELSNTSYSLLISIFYITTKFIFDFSFVYFTLLNNTNFLLENKKNSSLDWTSILNLSNNSPDSYDLYLLSSSYMYGYVLGSFIIYFILDNVRKESKIKVILLTFSISSFLIFFKNIYFFLVMLIIHGACHLVSSMIVVSSMNDYFPSQFLRRKSVFLLGSTCISSIFACYVYSNNINFQLIYYGFSFVSLVTMLFGVFFIVDNPFLLISLGFEEEGNRNLEKIMKNDENNENNEDLHRKLLISNEDDINPRDNSLDNKKYNENHSQNEVLLIIISYLLYLSVSYTAYYNIYEVVFYKNSSFFFEIYSLSFILSFCFIVLWKILDDYYIKMKIILICLIVLLLLRSIILYNFLIDYSFIVYSLQRSISSSILFLSQSILSKIYTELDRLCLYSLLLFSIYVCLLLVPYEINYFSYRLQNEICLYVIVFSIVTIVFLMFLKKRH